MDKRQRHNLLLILAAGILLIGVIVQVYFILTAGEKSGAPQATQGISQEQ